MVSDDTRDSDESERPYSWENHNTASENSQVGGQAGFHFGSNYNSFAQTFINNGESTEELLQRAVSYLARESARAAEAILHDLMWSRQPTTKTAYYYALSVLGGRSLYEIDSELIEKIRKAWDFCSPEHGDPWRQALDVVMGLLRCLPHKAVGDATSDGDEWDGQWGEFEAFDNVPTKQQDEIRRSLALIANGRARERMDAGARERVLAAKVEADRAARVWKFFEPEPLEPRLYPLPPLDITPPGWRSFFGGALLLLAGATVLAVGPWWAVIPVLGVLAASARLLTPFGVASAAQRLVEAAQEREARRLRTLPEPRSPGHWVPTQLVRNVSTVVDAQFTKFRPHRAGNWSEQTVEVRAYLKERLVAQYGNSQRSADAVAWLGYWYARRAAKLPGPAWQPQGPDEVDPPEPDPLETASPRRWLWLAAVATVATLGALIAGGQLPAAVLLGLGEGWTVVLRQRLAVLRRAMELRGRAEQRLLAEDRQGLKEWRALLADRPTDAEMARWLAMDKAHMRYDAIERAGLVGDDVVTHVVMTEGADGARQHHLEGQPVRYTAYRVRVFILTYSGVQEVTADLDFHTDDIIDEQRGHFRYDTVACADAREKGVRGVRQVKNAPARRERLRTVSFTLRLVNGDEAVVLQETYRPPDSDVALDDTDEDITRLILDNSGFESVLRILESVASEGGDWIRHDQERRQRWAHSLFD